MMKRRSKNTHFKLNFIYCDECREIHEPNIKCTGNLELGELIND